MSTPTPDQKAKAVVADMMQKDFCSQWMGVEVLEIQEGYCKIRMQVKRDMLNGFGILHGGIAYAFADSAFAFASNSYGRLSVSINGSMHFAKSAKEDDWLIAEAKPLHIGYRTAEFDVDIYDQENEDVMYRFRGSVYRSSKEVLSE
ncbi:MAG: hotdog fold thioesterase [Bacteroidota bacterium]